MCGIVGFIGTDAERNTAMKMKFLRQALITGVLRGEDSTGVFFSDENPKHTAGYLKQAIDGPAFVWGKDFLDYLENMKSSPYVIGHNRAATVGNVTTANAHPFQERSITLVHNGTLDRFPKPKDRDLPKRITVDSNAIAYALSYAEPDEAVSVLDGLWGAYALVWHDARDGTVNFARNYHRPLHFGWSTHADAWFFTSEEMHLRWLATRCRLGLKEVAQLDAHHLVKFTIGEKKPHVAKIPQRKSYYSGNDAGAGYGGFYYSGGKRQGLRGTKPANGGAGNGRPENSTGLSKKEQRRERAREGLLSLGLTPDDLIACMFWEHSPTSNTKKPGKRRYLSTGVSLLDTCEVECYTMPEELYQSSMADEVIMCRPVGVRELADGQVVVVVDAIKSEQMGNTVEEIEQAEERHYEEPAEETEPPGTVLYKDLGRLGQAALQPPKHENGTVWIHLPNKTTIGPSTWKRLADNGCGDCGDKPAIEDVEQVWWPTTITGQDFFVCNKCVQANMAQGDAS
jgi:hypothetical protein